MTARVQDSPFRETAWDQRLDKMLDDLKTTVNPDEGRPSSRRDDSFLSTFSHHHHLHPNHYQDKPDQTFLDIFRSSSRSESRNSNRSGVEDLGLMKHRHNEYTSPDKTTKVVSDQFEYESGDPDKHYKKKVMKSTYSNYKVSGDITTDLDSLKQGPSQSIMDASRTTSEQQTDNTRVVSASQKVANKLVDALSTIGPDGKEVNEVTTKSEGVSVPSTGGSTDSNTIKRLKKDIKELDSMLEEMDHKNVSTSTNVVIETKTKKIVQKEERNLLEEKTEGKISSSGKTSSKSDVVVKEEKKKDERTTNHLSSTDGPTNSYSYSNKTSDYTTSRIPNGKPGYEDEELEIKQEPAGEVRKIVWRNRFEKTYEAQDGTPHISIEEESRRKREKHLQDLSSSISVNQHHSVSQHYPPAPPQISPGGQSWADPIPMPTPPHISPKGEPGVAYVYTYGQGQSGSQVQHLPPLNYVNVPPGTTIKHNDSAPSLSPSSGNQPVIYHYSYHYTLQPGHSLPEGVPQPPGTTSYPVQPALQVATPVDKGPYKSGPTSLNSYEYNKTTSSHTSSSAVDRSNTTNVIRHYSPERTTEPRYPATEPRYPANEPRFPTTTRDGPPYDDRYPRDTEPDSNRNISITINKSSRHVTHTKDYPSGGPSTSTPFPTPGRSRSSSPDRYPRGPSSPDRYPRGPGTAPYGTVTHVTRTSYSDSLERLRKPPHEGLPFPDTSPIRPKDDSKIPRRVDDLMTTLSDSEDGTHRRPLDRKGINGPRAHSPEREPLIIGTKVSSESTELSLSENKSDAKREETKNVAGPPVYYPPGHNQLFDESMHTMTLKENKRRGMAKWRMEKASGYKESSSSSQSKGGMAMVPVCLPLCCGAACVIM